MSILDQIAALFYDPAIFWGVPLVLALLYEAYRTPRTRKEGGG